MQLWRLVFQTEYPPSKLITVVFYNQERSQSYERMLREKSRVIRQTEKEHMNVSGKKHRSAYSVECVIVMCLTPLFKIFDRFAKPCPNCNDKWKSLTSCERIITRRCYSMRKRFGISYKARCVYSFSLFESACLTLTHVLSRSPW